MPEEKVVQPISSSTPPTSQTLTHSFNTSNPPSPHTQHTHTHAYRNYGCFSLSFSLFFPHSLPPFSEEEPSEAGGWTTLHTELHVCAHKHTDSHMYACCYEHRYTREALGKPFLINDTCHFVRREGWVCDIWCGR